MQPTKRSEEALLGFVRGELQWEEAAVPRVEVDFDRWTIREPYCPNEEVVRVSLADVASGFRAHAEDRDGLRRWAFLVLGASNHIAFTDELEQVPEGDLVLGALWDAALGMPVSEEARGVLARATPSSEGEHGATVEPAAS